jgi:Bifunctional DNA primase/polymerase, N-terminal/Primase C terminal 1 (PriCT-1)
MLITEAARSGKTLSGEPARDVAALWYATELLWPVFPCEPHRKKPLINQPARCASRNPAVILRWWSRWPKANPATPTGPRTGMFVVDVDGDEGEQSLTDLQKHYGPLPTAAPMQRTGSGNGRQILLQWPRGCTIRNSVSKIADHLDIRGENGHIMLPPAVHSSRCEYRWIFGCGPWEISPPPAPTWFLNQLDPRGVANDLVRHDLLPGVPEGRRDSSLFVFLKDHAGHCANFEELLALAFEFNASCSPPNNPARVRLTATSVWERYHLAGRIWQKGEEARVQTRRSAFDQIKSHSDAYVLETELRFAHGARDEPFAMVPEAMAAAQLIPGWTKHRYREARCILLRLGRIELGSRPGWWCRSCG